MTTENVVEPLKDGTVVKILNSGYPRAKIAEFRGPLGPKGESTGFWSRKSRGASISKSSKANSRCLPTADANLGQPSGCRQNYGRRSQNG